MTEAVSYTPERLASMSDADLLGLYEWTVGDVGEGDRECQRLAAECERRGLIERVEPGPPPEGQHFATTVEDFAALLDAMEDQDDAWKEAIFADAEKQGFSREEVERAFQERIAPVEITNDNA